MNTTPLLYSLTPSDPAGHCYSVHLTLSKPSAEGQVLTLPAWIPGSYLIRDFARQIVSLSASSEDRPVEVTKIGNHTWQCAPCLAPLHIEYTVYAWDLSVRGAHFDETHAFLNGTSVFLCPVGHEQTPCLLKLNSPPHTDAWKVYTSLPEATDHRDAARRHGFGMYRAPDYDALIDHPIEMGTPLVARFTAHGAQHEMVFTGVTPNLDLDRIVADTQKICEAQIALFEPDSKHAPFLDSSDRYVFMTMVTSNDYGGLEHRASTALMIPRHALPTIGHTQPGNDYQDYLGLVSHEYFHTWNVKRIKPRAFAPYDLSRENHTRLLWVFEGFTSYYDDLMLLRAGVITQADYLRILAKTISHVHRNPGRHVQSVTDSSFDAWTRFYKQDENSPNAIVSYYTKGSLVALGLDLLIRQETQEAHSLDDVMRLMWQRYGKHFYTGVQEGVAEDAMPALILEATGVDASDFIANYADGCNDVPLTSLLAAQGIRLEWKTSSNTPSLDVRTQSSQGTITLATVYSGGAAHKGGLSAGDTLVAINGLRVDSPDSLERLLRACRAGDTISVYVFRRDELRRFDVTLSAPASSECTLQTDQPQGNTASVSILA